MFKVNQTPVTKTTEFLDSLCISMLQTNNHAHIQGSKANKLNKVAIANASSLTDTEWKERIMCRTTHCQQAWIHNEKQQAYFQTCFIQSAWEDTKYHVQIPTLFTTDWKQPGYAPFDLYLTCEHQWPWNLSKDKSNNSVCDCASTSPFLCHHWVAWRAAWSCQTSLDHCYTSWYCHQTYSW